MSSLSIPARIPLRGRQRLHRQRMDLLAHAIAERGVNQLMLPDAGQALEGGETMTASQCWPSPATSTWWQSKPATIDCLMDSGVTMAVFLAGRL
jgi:hypothetical protein